MFKQNTMYFTLVFYASISVLTKKIFKICILYFTCNYHRTNHIPIHKYDINLQEKSTISLLYNFN